MFGRDLEPLKRRMDELEARLGNLDEGVLDGIQRRITELKRADEDLRTAIDLGIREVERRDNRIQSTVSRALKKLAANGEEPTPGLEAEARELRLLDAGRGEDEGVQLVRDDVGEAQAALQSLEGIPGEVGEEDVETMIRRRRRDTA